MGLNRREMLATAGRFLLGAHLPELVAPVADFFWDAPTASPTIVVRGFVFGYGTAIESLLSGRKCGWPYLHALCHAYAVASWDRPDWERAEWSRWAGKRDEETQQYWAQHYRKSIHPKFIDWLKNNGCEGDYTHMMQYVWGTPDQKLRAERRIRLMRGKQAFAGLQSLERDVYASRDACESAWQASDEEDNETGRQIGLRCPSKLTGKSGDPIDGFDKASIHEARFDWCEREVRAAGIHPETPEGPDTDRPWGPFHPLHPGPAWDFCPEMEEPWPLLEL